MNGNAAHPGNLSPGDAGMFAFELFENELRSLTDAHGVLDPAILHRVARQVLLVVHSPDISVNSSGSPKGITELGIILPGHIGYPGGCAMREPESSSNIYPRLRRN